MSLVHNCESVVFDSTPNQLPCHLQSEEAQIKDVHMDLGHSKDHSKLHSLWYEHEPQMSTWSAVAVEIKDISKAVCCHSGTGHQTPSQPLVAPQAKDINMVSQATWARDTNMVSKGSLSYRSTSQMAEKTTTIVSMIFDSKQATSPYPLAAEGPWTQT